MTLVDRLQRWAPHYARVAIAAAFLSAVAGRFGLWTGQLRWENFAGFIERTAELNAWAPRFMMPVLAWSATIAETSLAVALLAGVGVRWAAFGSAALLAWFGTAMLVYTGPKPPLDYSVFSASACALLLALHERRAATSREGDDEVRSSPTNVQASGERRKYV
jgi:putative oxidoreductase